jgi:hypothetical protein
MVNYQPILQKRRMLIIEVTFHGLHRI